MRDFVKPLSVVTSWKGLTETYQTLFKGSSDVNSRGPWLFRADSECDLLSSLDKVLRTCGRPQEQYPDVERYLVREFQRRYQHFSSWIPRRNDHLQWLAIMQHYGAPTRLLDWTYSFLVATYFAINRIDFGKKVKSKSPPDGDPERFIFALRPTPLSKAALESLSQVTKGSPAHAALSGIHPDDPVKQYGIDRSRRAFGDLILENWAPFVYHATPYHLNDRLSAQQGTFLTSGTVKSTFQQNIMALGESAIGESGFTIIPIRLDEAAWRDAMFELNRMNINQGTLFPGLQGFAESIKGNWCLLKPDYSIAGLPVFPEDEAAVE